MTACLMLPPWAGCLIRGHRLPILCPRAGRSTRTRLFGVIREPRAPRPRAPAARLMDPGGNSSSCGNAVRRELGPAPRWPPDTTRPLKFCSIVAKSPDCMPRRRYGRPALHLGSLGILWGPAALVRGCQRLRGREALLTSGEAHLERGPGATTINVSQGGRAIAISARSSHCRGTALCPFAAPRASAHLPTPPRRFHRVHPGKAIKVSP